MATTEKVTHGKAHTRYRLADGTIVPGVTTVLGVLNKPALVPWANTLGLQGIDTRNYVDELARIGTLAHALIEADLGAPAPDLTVYSPEEIDRAENALLSYYEWKRHHTIEARLIEHPMVSEEHRYGGTIDCFGVVDGVPTLLDVKTSKALYPEHFHQVAAYQRLLQEAGRHVLQACILRVGRAEDEGFDWHVRPTARLVPHWDLFAHALAIYRLQQELKKEAV